jgi:N-dimethylarginine dimethylaminohydrolase
MLQTEATTPFHVTTSVTALAQTLLMCSPEGFAVAYEINPWMSGHVGTIDHQLAVQQWLALYQHLSLQADIEIMAADPAWPDLVFTANAGLPLPAEKTFILSNFRHPQRQGEKAINRDWFETHGWRCVELDVDVSFEGAGDALFDSEGRLFVADGLRTDRAATGQLSLHVEGPIHSLRLIDPAFYHLDTCFCPLAGGYALYLPQAFDGASTKTLQKSFGARLIALTPDEGRLFCANAVNVEHTIVMNAPTPRLIALLTDAGFNVIATPLTEFMKSGGSAKCLTLRIA